MDFKSVSSRRPQLCACTPFVRERYTISSAVSLPASSVAAQKVSQAVERLLCLAENRCAALSDEIAQFHLVTKNLPPQVLSVDKAVLIWYQLLSLPAAVRQLLDLAPLAQAMPLDRVLEALPDIWFKSKLWHAYAFMAQNEFAQTRALVGLYGWQDKAQTSWVLALDKALTAVRQAEKVWTELTRFYRSFCHTLTAARERGEPNRLVNAYRILNSSVFAQDPLRRELASDGPIQLRSACINSAGDKENKKQRLLALQQAVIAFRPAERVWGELSLVQLSFCYQVAVAGQAQADQEIQKRARRILNSSIFARAPLSTELARQETYRSVFQLNSKHLKSVMDVVWTGGNWPLPLFDLVVAYARGVDSDLLGITLGCEELSTKADDAHTAADIEGLTGMCQQVLRDQESIEPVRLSHAAVWLFVSAQTCSQAVREAAFKLFHLLVGLFAAPMQHALFQAMQSIHQLHPHQYGDRLLKRMCQALVEALQEQRIWAKHLHPLLLRATVAGEKFPWLVSPRALPVALRDLELPETVLTPEHVKSYHDYQFLYFLMGRRESTQETASLLLTRVLREKSFLAAEILAEMQRDVAEEQFCAITDTVGRMLCGSAEEQPPSQLSLQTCLACWERLEGEQQKNWELFLILRAARVLNRFDADPAEFFLLASWMVRTSFQRQTPFQAYLQRQFVELWHESLFIPDRARLFDAIWQRLRPPASSEATALAENEVAHKVLSSLIATWNTASYTFFMQQCVPLHALLTPLHLLHLLRRLVAIQDERQAPDKLAEQLYWLTALIKECQVPAEAREGWMKEIREELATLSQLIRSERYKQVRTSQLLRLLEGSSFKSK